MVFRLHWRRLIGVLVLLVVILIVAVPAHSTQAQGGTQTTYTVQPGDNMFRISLRFGISVQALAAANNISNPNIIYVGQVLIIPAPGTVPPPANPGTPPTTPPPAPTTPAGTYTVVRGDTLSRIAQRFGISLAALISANNIPNPNLIYAGQVLVIPGGSGTTPPPANPQPGNPPPVQNPGTGGGFELGGHIANFGRVSEMRAAGMSWAKAQVRWHRGDNTGAAAGLVNEAHANGLKILIGVVGFPNEIDNFESYGNDLAAYLGQVAALGPDAIEIWNEPNLTREWPAGQVSATTYTQLLAKAYNAIKAANPNVMVISAAPAPTGFFGGCTGNGCDDIFFIRGMRQAGAANYMDCLGAHYNEGIISPDLRSGDPRGSHYTRYFFGMLDTYYNEFGGSKRVCWTELGYLSPEGFGGLPSTFAWAGNTTVAQHAEWLGRAATLSRSSGRVRLMIVWNVNFSGGSADDPQGGYAIVRPDGNCPACGTLGAAMR